ncbi:DUF2867 domain-containing protein [Streptomyces hiroshimensis]|uniref:DUF2867 domain-containing protein n=1 Tax=Streptomyces hiroshimensis TaxID=66424 RepID=A0ABQ2Y887_9ACTN|nr:DUF2867 domain-containing protein [Streptomyces hiroshimensis]GGX72471.1 hypothetical protein GCM10010324_17230 [Streptomyces hiroshimensis]
MRLPSTAHTSRPWRIHEIAHDFRLEDVWALPTPGGPDDLAHLVKQVSTGQGAYVDTRVGRTLFALRWKLGALFGWDKPGTGVGEREAGLRDRLPADLREGPRGPDFRKFTSVYQTHDEWAAEMSNETCRGVMHLGWVPDGNGGYHAQMAVLVKPNGLFGAVYMAGIKAFRYVGVYPALLRMIGREWEANAGERNAAGGGGTGRGEA